MLLSRSISDKIFSRLNSKFSAAKLNEFRGLTIVIAIVIVEIVLAQLLENDIRTRPVLLLKYKLLTSGTRFPSGIGSSRTVMSVRALHRLENKTSTN